MPMSWTCNLQSPIFNKSPVTWGFTLAVSVPKIKGVPHEGVRDCRGCSRGCVQKNGTRSAGSKIASIPAKKAKEWLRHHCRKLKMPRTSCSLMRSRSEYRRSKLGTQRICDNAWSAEARVVARGGTAGLRAQGGLRCSLTSPRKAARTPRD